MRERHLSRAILAGAAAWTMAIVGVVAQPPMAREDLTVYLPPGAGRDLVANQCTVCHDLRGTLQLRTSADGWEALVLDMGARGAPIMIDDVDVIVKYLSEAFGPTAPRFTDVNAATEEDLTKLPGVSPDAAKKLVAARAKEPLTSHDQVKAALGLDAAAFEKIRPYLYVKPAAAAN